MKNTLKSLEERQVLKIIAIIDSCETMLELDAAKTAAEIYVNNKKGTAKNLTKLIQMEAYFYGYIDSKLKQIKTL